MVRQIEFVEIEKEQPQPGDVILAELNGCNLASHAFITIREGEGFGHIRRWALVHRPETTGEDRQV